MSNSDWQKDPNYLRLYGFPVKIDASVPEGVVYVKQQSSYTIAYKGQPLPPLTDEETEQVNTALTRMADHALWHLMYPPSVPPLIPFVPEPRRCRISTQHGICWTIRGCDHHAVGCPMREDVAK